MRRTLLLAATLAVSLAPAPSRGAQAVAVSVEDLARASELVIRGRVVATQARWVEGRIYTYAEIETTVGLRGAAPARVTVVTPGGVVGDLGQRVDGAATFTQGEETVVFLGKAHRGERRVSGMAQGKFAVKGPVARPDLSRLAIVEARVAGGERRAEEMPVAELERRVRSVP